MPENIYYGIGRRKTAIARVRITPGAGKIVVNDREMSSYFNSKILEEIIKMPLKLTEHEEKLDIVANINGGGIHAQADAMKLGIARALSEFDEGTTPVLKKNNCLTRDSREKERKKYGQRGRRAKFQYSKR